MQSRLRLRKFMSLSLSMGSVNGPRLRFAYWSLRERHKVPIVPARRPSTYTDLTMT